MWFAMGWILVSQAINEDRIVLTRLQGRSHLTMFGLQRPTTPGSTLRYWYRDRYRHLDCAHVPGKA
jgi:hypothetical protein